MATDDLTPPAPKPGLFPRNDYARAMYTAAVAFAGLLLGGLATYLGVPPATVTVIEEKQVPGPVQVVPDEPVPAGWVNDPDAVWEVAQNLPARVFSDTPAGQVPARDLPASVYLWKAYLKVTGKPAPMKNQLQVGSCVSFGTNTAVERTLANEIAAGRPFDWSRFAEEATYGGSRVEIGGGRIRGDGSVGAWAAKFVTTYGMVPRKAYGPTDLTTYSESRCREWGQRGVPDEFEAVARTFPVKDTTQVKDWTEAKKALASGYGIAICSNQGFAMARDANGVCRPSGSWAHCMACTGYHTENGREYGHITNSWGERAHTGPVGWGEPNPDGFWAESSVIDRMLRQGDSWAFSGVTGFPAKKLDLFIAVPREPQRLLAGLANPEVLLAW